MIDNADSLRSGLAKSSLQTMNEYVNVYDLTDFEVQDAQKLLLRKVAETSEFIRNNSYETLKSITLKYE